MTTKVLHDYTQFDQKLLRILEAGTSTASGLSIALKLDAKPMTTTHGEEFRVVDRRLQAMRKKGIISWARRGRTVIWQINN